MMSEYPLAYWPYIPNRHYGMREAIYGIKTETKWCVHCQAHTECEQEVTDVVTDWHCTQCGEQI